MHLFRRTKSAWKFTSLGTKKPYFPMLSICWKYCTDKKWQAQVHLVNKTLQQILLLLALPCKEASLLRTQWGFKDSLANSKSHQARKSSGIVKKKKTKVVNVNALLPGTGKASDLVNILVNNHLVCILLMVYFTF